MIEPAEQPLTLFHYTDARGLLGIVRDARLWATDAHFLNDQSQLSYSAEVVAGYLRGAAALIERGGGHRTATETRQIVLFRRAAELFEHPSADAAVYLSCLSSKKDLLSQWRAYGPYAVGFNTEELRTAELVRNSHEPLSETPLEGGVVVQRVSYGLDDSATQAIANILPELSKAAVRLPGNSQAVNALIVPILSRIKHPSFEDEHEWRLLLMGELNGADLQFADGRSAITPHVELVLRPGMISEVMVGPAAHAMLKCDGVRELLHSCGQHLAAVSHSESPYRA